MHGQSIPSPKHWSRVRGNWGWRFTFDALARPVAPVHLVVESPQRFAMAVNGQAVVGAQTFDSFKQTIDGLLPP